MNPLFIKGKCFNDCEATLTVGQEKTELYVCMEYLAGVSNYFRAMFYGDFKERNKKQFEVTDETSKDIICFFNAINPDPTIRKITDDSMELLMRLSDKFQCDLLKNVLKDYIQTNGSNCKSGTIFNWLVCSQQYNMTEEIFKVCLDVQKIGDDTIELLMRWADQYKNDVMKERLKQYIEENEPKCKSAATILNWLIWSLQYNMPQQIINICLPAVACLPLSILHDNRDKIGMDLYDKLIDAKYHVIFKALDFHDLVAKRPYICRRCGADGGPDVTYHFCLDNKCCRCYDCITIFDCCGAYGCIKRYYKCTNCSHNLSICENTEQCICARKNYKMVFDDMSH